MLEAIHARAHRCKDKMVDLPTADIWRINSDNVLLCLCLGF